MQILLQFCNDGDVVDVDDDDGDDDGDDGDDNDKVSMDKYDKALSTFFKSNSISARNSDNINFKFQSS